jgi:hypothetical protein
MQLCSNKTLFMAGHGEACNSSIWEVEVGGSRAQGQPGQHRETCLKTPLFIVNENLNLYNFYVLKILFLFCKTFSYYVGCTKQVASRQGDSCL